HSDNDNSGGEAGGGLATTGGASPSLTLLNTIVANNYRGSGTTTADDVSGSVAANYSLIGTTSGATISGDHNLTGDPMLGPLADNGGPTKTMALLPSSPAINAGTDVGA